MKRLILVGILILLSVLACQHPTGSEAASSLAFLITTFKHII